MAQKDKILIGSADPEFAFGLKAQIEEAGRYLPVIVTGAQEVIEVEQVFYFKAILLDALIDDFPGFELCRRLRDAGREAPIIIFSQIEEAEGEKIRFSWNADKCLKKAIPVPDLAAKVEEVIETRTRTLLSWEKKQEEEGKKAAQFAGLEQMVNEDMISEMSGETPRASGPAPEPEPEPKIEPAPEPARAASPRPEEVPALAPAPEPAGRPEPEPPPAASLPPKELTRELEMGFDQLKMEPEKETPSPIPAPEVIPPPPIGISREEEAEEEEKEEALPPPAAEEPAAGEEESAPAAEPPLPEPPRPPEWAEPAPGPRAERPSPGGEKVMTPGMFRFEEAGPEPARRVSWNSAVTILAGLAALGFIIGYLLA